MLTLIPLLLVFVLISSQDYHVKDFGAVGDGKTDDTNAVRAALAAAAKTNGGRVIFDSGYTFLTGCFNVSSNVIFEVQGKILGTTDVNGYVWSGVNNPDSWENLFQATNATNITVTGGGVIDGQGSFWWPCAKKCGEAPCSNKHRPRMLGFNYVDGINIYNITLQNSPMQHMLFGYCANVHIYNITILAPSSHDKELPSHNTDGMDIINTVNVIVENSYISTGDDAVAMTSDAPSEGGRTTANVLVRNLNISTSHGISIGSGTAGGVENITVHDIYMNGSDAGARIKSLKGRGGLVQNVTYYNMKLENMDYCIYLTYKYSGASGDVKPGLPDYRNINIHHINCTAEHGWFLEGLNQTMSIYANFSDINIQPSGKKITLFEQCEYTYGPCDNTTVTPSCPPCMAAHDCVDKINYCSQYTNLCSTPSYRDNMCDMCRKTCNLCNVC